VRTTTRRGAEKKDKRTQKNKLQWERSEGSMQKGRGKRPIRRGEKERFKDEEASR